MGDTQSSYVSLFWQSSGYQQNRYERTLGAAKILIGYCGNLMVTITTDMKISLAHSKFLWIMLAIFRLPAKLTFGTTKALIGYFGNLMVGGTTDVKISLRQTAKCTELALVVQTLFDQ